MATDDLFRLPLDEFTAARNGLARDLKDAGRTQEAEAVRALPKPPLSAWTVNQLFWRHRRAFDALMEAGERLRKAHASGRGSSELRAPLDARRAALAALTKLARTILRDAGHPPTPAVARRIATTLEALAAYGAQPNAPLPGRLTADVDPPGFDALATLVPRAGRAARGGPSRVIPFEAPATRKAAKKLDPDTRKRLEAEAREAERRAAARALRDAQRALSTARTAAARAEAALKKAAARAKIADTRKAALEAQFEKAVAEADAARQAARRVAAAAEEAAQAVADAEEQLRTLKSGVRRQP